MINNAGEIINELIVRMSINTTSGYYSDAILRDWTDQAYRYAAGYRKWPLTEGRTQTTYSSSSEEWSFEGYKADSIRLLQIGGKRYEKKNFEDYLIYREEETSGADKIFSDHGNLIYINPQAAGTGTLTAYGQYVPAQLDLSDLTSSTAKTVFSDTEDEGNLAIVELMQSYAYTRERELERADYHFKKAIVILEQIWKKYADEQSYYQTHNNRGIFKRIDVVGGELYGESFKRDQFT